MKADSMRDMSIDQIEDQVDKLKKENTSRVRAVRRDIARLLTVARSKRAGGAKRASKE